MFLNFLIIILDKEVNLNRANSTQNFSLKNQSALYTRDA